MIKIMIVILLLAIVISLFSSLFFLVRDQGKSFRTVHALAIRVCLAIILMALILYAVQSGQLQFNPSPINAF